MVCITEFARDAMLIQMENLIFGRDSSLDFKLEDGGIGSRITR